MHNILCNMRKHVNRKGDRLMENMSILVLDDKACLNDAFEGA